jgi:hypothetical protein
VSGRITEYGSGAAVSGARVTPEGGTAVTTDASGNYRISGTTPATSNPYKVTVESSGHLTREFYVQYRAGDRTGLDANVIRDAAPFSLGFYRQLVRDDYDKMTGSLELVWRLTESPKFYVRTVDQKGRAIEPEVLNVVLPAIRKAVGDWSNGVLSVQTLETGAETRERTDGWVVVNITRDYQSPYCGWAYVGSSRGEIELVDDRCACGSTKISGTVVAHEVGHSMGFFHVDDSRNLMFPYVPGKCPPGNLSANERYHSALAYSRTRGNADPDADHPSAYMAMPMDTGGPDIKIVN